MTDVITKQSRVTLQFEIRLENGDIVDSTFEKAPATFVMGDGSMFAGFENKLIGMMPGERSTFIIKPEEGFGQPNPNNIQTFKRSQFDAEMDIQPGMMFSFSDAQNSELPGVVKTVTETFVDVDFNHPLAGRDLSFEVMIHAVEEV
jgi:FKBP-type peptidyl-prolyl cis-trans isomerase SlpA